MKSIMTHRYATLWLFGLFYQINHAQSTYWFDRAQTGVATEATTKSEMDETGFLLGSIQSGSAIITNYDTNGDIQWSEKINIPGVPPLRNVHTVDFIDDDGAFFVLASSAPTHPLTSSERYYLIEFDSDHALVFSISLEDTVGNCGMNVVNGRRIGHAQRIPGEGYFINMPGSNNFNCLCRVNESGDLQWWRAYSAADWTSGENRYFSGFFGCPMGDGGILLPNTVQGGFHLHRLDASGEIIWAKKYITGNPYDQAWRAVELADGSIILTGLHGENINSGAHWIMLLKLDSEGEVVWHRRISKEGLINYPGFPFRLKVSTTGEILIHARGTLDSDHLMRCDPNGNVLEMILLQPGSGFHEGIDLDFLPPSDLLITGSVQTGNGQNIQEAPFISISSDLGSILCNVIPVSWIDQAYPSSLSIVETGTYIPYVHRVVSHTNAESSPTAWEREEACTLFPTAIEPRQTTSFRAYPTLMKQGDALILEHPTELVDFSLTDCQGRTARIELIQQGKNMTHILPTHFASGVYVANAKGKDGISQTFKVVMTE